MSSARNVNRDGASYHSKFYGRQRFRGLSALEPSGFRVSTPSLGTPQTQFSHATTYAASARFRSIVEDQDGDQSYVAVRNDQVLFATPSIRELDPQSSVRLAGQQSVRPMTVENEEFFRIKKPLLSKKLEELQEMIISRTFFKPPNKETKSFVAGIIRAFVNFTIKFYRLNGDVENRMRFTRAMQEWLFMASGLESFLLAEIVKSHDSDKPASYAAKRAQAFKIRNTFRIIVNNMSNYDRLYHWGFMLKHNRIFDFLDQFPIINNFTAFPGTENIVGSRNLAVNSFLRNVFEGTLIGRRLAGGRESLITDNPGAYAQNLAAEGNSFETSNRQQHGTYIGRTKTNAFRLEHRLPTDESTVRTFQGNPGGTMLNNGVEHILTNVGMHWRNMLFQENGNFGHQRQELLDPVQTLRYHIPEVLVTLTNLRGRNNFDNQVVGPLIQRLQAFDPGAATALEGGDAEKGTDLMTHDITKTCAIARKLVASLLAIVEPVCAGIPPRVKAFRDWLDAIRDSIDDLEIEANGVKDLVSSVEDGIRLGYQLIKVIDWKIPEDDFLETAVLNHLTPGAAGVAGVDVLAIENALDRLAPRDARCLQELIRTGRAKSRAAELLIGRTRTLLHREIRRRAIDTRLLELSRGQLIEEKAMVRNEWYYVKSDSGSGIFQYKGKAGSTKFRFKDVDVGNSILVQRDGSVVINEYVPVAEAIARAQKAFMNLELDYLKRFAYNAYMEFGSGEVDGSLRTQLRRLAVVAQLQSYELDNSRRMVLSEFLRKPEDTVYSTKNCRPQNLVVIGGGPTGLITSIHAVQSCLMSGGMVTLYESRDAYKKEAATFERAQVVRLDGRWIAMMRFHCGTAFEDQFVPLRGETDAHLGNTIPLQGFVELTIKSMEIMLHFEAIKLRSRGLMNYYSGSGIDFDVEEGFFSKKGSTLKIGDSIRIDDKPWRVTDHVYPRPLQKGNVRKGVEYDILFPRDEKVRTYKLEEVYEDFDFYEFKAMDEEETMGLPNALQGPFRRFQIFPKGSARVSPQSVVLKRMDGPSEEKVLKFDDIKKDNYELDVFDSHVLIAAGKPKTSDEHFKSSTEEPYGVACIEGLKVSMIMHLFGEKRFDVGNFSKYNLGFTDDLRSQLDQNTRLVGDFTKTVAVPPIIKTMARRLGISAGKKTERTTWTRHIEKTITDGGLDPTGMVDTINRSFKDLIFKAAITEDIVAARKTYNNGTSIPPASLGFVRERLQTRYFEVGDNFYLGMELSREYDTWKNETAAELIPAQHGRLRFKLMAQFDRLWFESTIEVVNFADVFNPDGRSQMPSFYLIPSLTHQRLSDLAEGEAFTIGSPDGTKFEVKVRESHAVRLIAPNGQEISLPSRTKIKDDGGNIRTVGEEGMKMVVPVDMFYVIEKVPRKGFSVVRNAEGYVCELSDKLPVWRQSDLARSPDGFTESAVALAAFPVSLKVNIRTMRVLRAEGDDGYITGFIGDAQASPHFMRYSGLTGACINAMTFNNFVAQAVAGVPFADRVKRYSLETNWSNGEVADRGLGHNYGEDGFCRPGFPYKYVVTYIYSRVEELSIIGEDLDLALTRDWKAKLAAGLVPRGLENDSLFRDSLHKLLLSTVEAIFIDKAEELLEVGELDKPTLKAVKAATAAIGDRFDGGAEPNLSKTVFKGLDPYTADSLLSIAFIIQGVVEGLKQSVDYAFDLRTQDARVSSELFHQAKSVDSFIDDFALEAQMFANGLTQGAALAAGSVALSTTDSQRNAAIVLGILGINTAFASMTNVSRYRNRNEEARVIFFDEKLPRIVKGVFSLMSVDQRMDTSIPNPFVEELEQKAAVLFQQSVYYGFSKDAVEEFRVEYQALLSSIHNTKSVIYFVKRLLQYYIADSFQSNPYLKDQLVQIYKILNEMLHLMRQQHTGGQVAGAMDLYKELLEFHPLLEASLQRGTIRFGFLKKRPWYQWSLFTGSGFFLSLTGFPTMSNQTRRIMEKLETVSKEGEGVFLRREVRDFQELYFAGRESAITSLLFITVFLAFLANIGLTISRFIELGAPRNEVDALEWDWLVWVVDALRYALVVTIFGALLATVHQARKISLLSGLHKRLGVGRQAQGPIKLVRYLTRTQQVLALTRIAVTGGSSAALLWTLYNISFEESSDIPPYIAAISVGVAILSVLFFFVIELGVRYGLDPNLGALVLEPFMDEIEDLKRGFVDPRAGGVGIETQQAVDREVWEYTAREFCHLYRFDAVFASDRFGSIFQYLQAGAPRP